MTRPLLVVPPRARVPADVAAAVDVLATSSPHVAASVAARHEVVMAWDPAFAVDRRHVEAHLAMLRDAGVTVVCVAGEGPGDAVPEGAFPIALLSTYGNNFAPWIAAAEDATPSALAVHAAVAGAATTAGAPAHAWASGTDRVAAAERIGRARARAALALPPGPAACAVGGFGDGTARERAVRRVLISRWLPGRLAVAIARRLPAGSALPSRIAYWRAVARVLGSRRTAMLVRGVPVLMFHAFARPGERPSRYVVTRGALARRLRLLRLAGYRPITLDELVDALHAGTPPRRAYVVTVDDGYGDNATVAEPVLAAYGVPATVFVVTGAIGGANEWDDGGVLRARPMMGAADVQSMHGRGLMSIGAHTRTHPHLTHLALGRAREEIAASLHDVCVLTGAEGTTFAYPHGDRSDDVIAAARDAGARCALSVRHGRARLADDVWDLPRIDVRGDESLWTFARTVMFGGARNGSTGT